MNKETAIGISGNEIDRVFSHRLLIIEIVNLFGQRINPFNRRTRSCPGWWYRVSWK